jgi:cytochrome P450
MGAMRVTKEDTEVGSFSIPSGWNVYIPTYAANRDPGMWENPESFDAERFMDEEKRTKLFLHDGSDSCPARPLFVLLVRYYTLEMLRSFTWTPSVNPKENLHKLIPVPRPVDKFRVTLGRFSLA